MSQRHPCWAIWKGMKQRCDNPNRKDYSYYGGRGIGYDPKWKTLAGFLEDMGERPSPAHTLDRINPDQGYSKSNCRWATRAEQSQNTRAALRITRAGKTQTLSAWARELGMSVSGMWRRWHTHGEVYV